MSCYIIRKCIHEWYTVLTSGSCSPLAVPPGVTALKCSWQAMWNEFTSKVSMNHAAMHPRTTSTLFVLQSHSAILATILCVSQLRLRHFAYVCSQYLHLILALFRSAANPSVNDHLLLWSPQHKKKYVYICRPATTRFALSTYWNLDCMSCKMPAALRNKGSSVVVDHDMLNEDSLALVLIDNTPFGGWFFGCSFKPSDELQVWTS